MEMKGYKAPYRSIMKYGRPASSEMKADDMYDVSHHTQYFRMKAAAKKNILDRVKSAIASHKIALGHLEEYASIECSGCQAKYRGHELEKLTSGTCPCGSNELELILNPSGVYRLEILNYLPLSGDYMVKMSELSATAREAFRKMVRLLKQEKRGIVKTLTVVIKVLEDGRWVRKRLNIDPNDQLGYERMIRQKYGRNARIEFLQYHRKKPTIINDKHVQNALSLGYVKHSEEMAGKLLPIILKDHLLDYDRLIKYEDIIKASEDEVDRIKDEWEDASVLNKKIRDKLLHENQMIDDKGVIKPDLENDLNKKIDIEKELFIGTPQGLILWDLMRYYLSTSYDRRSKYSGPFPYLRPTLDTNQLKTFQKFPKKAAEFLKEYHREKIAPIESMDGVLSYKFEIEKKTQGLHFKMDPSLGAAIITMKGNVSPVESSKIFHVSVEEMKNAQRSLETFQEPSTKKAKRFLEMVKG
jgi:Zn-finger domain-containing protein